MPVMTIFMWGLQAPNIYILTIGGYQSWGIGAAGDSMTRHNDMQLTTFDRDNDKWSSNCARPPY